MTLNVPVIVTDCTAFKEIGVKNGENGYIVDFDLEQVNIEQIYKNIPKFKYEPLEDNYGNLLAKGESQYQKLLNKFVMVKCTLRYFDIFYKVWKTPDDEPYKMDYFRAQKNQERGFIKILESK